MNKSERKAALAALIKRFKEEDPDVASDPLYQAVEQALIAG